MFYPVSLLYECNTIEGALNSLKMKIFFSEAFGFICLAAAIVSLSLCIGVGFFSFFFLFFGKKW